MHIDWFTFVAQIVNFFVLVVILRHVLYRPILEALETRRRTVETTVAEAATAREAADLDRKALSEERNAYEQRKIELHKLLDEEMEAERAKLTEAAHLELEELSKGWKQRIAQEKASAGRIIAELAGDELVAITRRMIRDLSDSELEEAMVRAFLRRWRETPAEEQKRRLELIRNRKNEIIVHTSAELSEQLRNEIIRLLAGNEKPETMATQASVCRFETTPELIGGIEVCIDDRRISWSCAEYLSMLEQRVHEILQERIS